MRIIVICGNEECGKEFDADTSKPEWECPNCGRLISNQNYPFLTAKFMEAKVHPENADWQSLYEELLEKAQKLVAEKEAKIEELEAKLQKKK